MSIRFQNALKHTQLNDSGLQLKERMESVESVELMDMIKSKRQSVRDKISTMQTVADDLTQQDSERDRLFVRHSTYKGDRKQSFKMARDSILSSGTEATDLGVSQRFVSRKIVLESDSIDMKDLLLEEDSKEALAKDIIELQITPNRLGTNFKPQFVEDAIKAGEGDQDMKE